MAALNTIEMQPGPQRQAACSTADIIFFGGAKGGGKSRWLVQESAKWYDVPGQSSIIFRRTSPELKGDGSLWEETQKIYPLLGAEPIESQMRWKFPSGKSTMLRHLQHLKDAYAWNGKNIGDIGFDQLETFQEQQFWILMSCQRSMVGGYEQRPRIRATMNPDPDCWILPFIEWYIDGDGYAIPERSGVVRWFSRRDGVIMWYASKEDALADKAEMPKSFTFIKSTVYDNPALLLARPEYLANLRALPPVEQARYLGGNWRVRAQAGDFFRETWFTIRGDRLDQMVRHLPTDDDIVRWFRMWDLAGTPWKGNTVMPGTPARSDGDEPDWTRGGLFGLTRDNRLILLDMQSWRDSPGAIEEGMIATALRDGPHVTVCVGHDPGQAGNYQIEALEKSLRRRGRVRDFVAVRATKGKEEYASVASRMAFLGRIFVQRAPWNRALFSELEGFPTIGKKDQTDVLSQAVAYAIENPASLWGPQSPGLSRAEHFLGYGGLDVDVNRIGRRMIP